MKSLAIRAAQPVSRSSNQFSLVSFQTIVPKMIGSEGKSVTIISPNENTPILIRKLSYFLHDIHALRKKALPASFPLLDARKIIDSFFSCDRHWNDRHYLQ
jgi:hypothetical protein